MQLETILSVEETVHKGDASIIKVVTELNESPNLYDYFHVPSHRENHRFIDSQKHLLFYIE
jgi:hypothetical protein